LFHERIYSLHALNLKEQQEPPTSQPVELIFETDICAGGIHLGMGIAGLKYYMEVISDEFRREIDQSMGTVRS
jgi:hypothetical protein